MKLKLKGKFPKSIISAIFISLSFHSKLRFEYFHLEIRRRDSQKFESESLRHETQCSSQQRHNFFPINRARFQFLSGPVSHFCLSLCSPFQFCVPCSLSLSIRVPIIFFPKKISRTFLFPSNPLSRENLSP